MNDDDRDALIQAHFREYARLNTLGEKAKEARLSLLRKLRAADPDYYTQDRLADPPFLDGCTDSGSIASVEVRP